MTDYTALRTYEALADHYVAAKLGRPPRRQPDTDLERQAFDLARQVCEWRLGRSPADEGQGERLHPLPIDLDTLLACLKYLAKAVRWWNRQHGQRSYLEYIGRPSAYAPPPLS